MTKHEYETLDPIVRELLKKRNISTPEAADRFFAPDYDRDLHDPFLFANMQKVVDRFARARDAGETVGIYGDFDADGVTGSALFREAVDGLGISCVAYIPDKQKEGHGISTAGLEFMKERNVTLLCTVDCGMSNASEVECAHGLGMDTILLDHHLPVGETPKAYAIINPHLEDSGYPFADLCGAGVAFKTAIALYTKLQPGDLGQTKWLLDLVALGTVADCMPLVDENRVFVKYGLVVLSKTRRVGLQQLFEVGSIRASVETPPSATTIGFQIAPRINAAGRMAHAMIAHNLLLAEDYEEAYKIAVELEQLNRKRQRLSDALSKKALQEIEERGFESLAYSVSNTYPLGLVGLVAGKLAEKLRVPVGIFWQDDKECRGSFRSVEGVHITECLESCGDILVQFGGHEQAAGVTLGVDKFDEFISRLDARIQEVFTKKKKTTAIEVDGELEPEQITFSFLDVLRRFEPFGEANAQPKWRVRNLEVVDTRFVGSHNKHLKLRLGGRRGERKVLFDAIGFNMGVEFFHIATSDTVDLVCSVEENIFNGTRSLQLNILDIHKH